MKIFYITDNQMIEKSNFNESENSFLMVKFRLFNWPFKQTLTLNKAYDYVSQFILKIITYIIKPFCRYELFKNNRMRSSINEWQSVFSRLWYLEQNFHTKMFILREKFLFSITNRIDMKERGSLIYIFSRIRKKH